jgi:hypothetical protein
VIGQTPAQRDYDGQIAALIALGAFSALVAVFLLLPEPAPRADLRPRRAMRAARTMHRLKR